LLRAGQRPAPRFDSRAAVCLFGGEFRNGEHVPHDRTVPPPKPWPLHWLLGLAFSGDNVVRQLVYLPTGIEVPLNIIRPAVILLLLGLLLWRRDPRFAPSRTVRACMALLAFYALYGVTVTIFRTGGLTFYPIYKLVGVFVFSIVGMGVVQTMMQTEQDLRRFAVVLTTYAAVIVVFAMPYILTGQLLMLMPNEQTQFGLLGLPIVTGHDIGFRVAPMVLLPAAIWLGAGRTPRAWRTALVMAVQLAFLVTVFSAGHRSATAAMVVAIGYRMVLLRRRKEMFAAVAAALVMLATAPTLIGGDFTQSLERVGRLLDVQSRFTDYSFKERTVFYGTALTIVAERPMTGVGFGEFATQVGDKPGSRQYPHNLFLEYLVDIGVLGLPIIVFILWTMLTASRGLRQETAVAFLGMFGVFFMIALVTGDAIRNHNLYMLIGLTPLFHRLKRAREAEPPSEETSPQLDTGSTQKP
jgi:O-antigen ligase